MRSSEKKKEQGLTSWNWFFAVFEEKKVLWRKLHDYRWLYGAKIHENESLGCIIAGWCRQYNSNRGGRGGFAAVAINKNQTGYGFHRSGPATCLIRDHSALSKWSRMRTMAAAHRKIIIGNRKKTWGLFLRTRRTQLKRRTRAFLSGKLWLQTVRRPSDACAARLSQSPRLPETTWWTWRKQWEV